jgi:L-threonylcarbamoyladenylate synthase
VHCWIGTDIEEAAEWLRKGETVGIPTETVYGLAANAFNAEAVLKIYSVKNRPAFDPLIVHTGSIESVGVFVRDMPELAVELMRRFWPGPLTLILPRKNLIPDIVTSGLPTVGIRMPDHSMTLQLLNNLPFPLAAPSANPFGYISPTTAQHVKDQLGDRIPYILDGGPCRVGVESTIVSEENNTIVIHRAGGITVEELKECGRNVVFAEAGRQILAPGTLGSHYAPAKTLIFGTPRTLFAQSHPPGSAVICLSRPAGVSGDFIWYELSPEGNLSEAATRLFAVMRELDASSVPRILAIVFPETGLGLAINDRLRRAAFRKEYY